MRKPLLFITLIATLNISKVHACSCGYLGGFIYAQQVSDLVVYGEVIEYDSFFKYDDNEEPLSMKFLIIKKFRGLEQRDTISVLGDDGAECRPYIAEFPPGSRWLLALQRTSNSDYEISICGEFYLPVINGSVVGRIFSRDNNVPEKQYDYNYVVSELNQFEKYPIQRPSKSVSLTSWGIEHMTTCDELPSCSLDLKTLTKKVNQLIRLPEIFTCSNDSYLILARVVITSNGAFYYKGNYNCYWDTSEFPLDFSIQLETILRYIGTWKPGKEAGEPIAAELVIPILLENQKQ
ncbi:hypothetical protein EYV94_28305 [Puteibacter caeruleilacunae]|nr:hypothetical protein EYV94_28305 [Puteibacter caeruleilacunae]